MISISGSQEFVFPGYKDPKKLMNSQSANMALVRIGYRGILVSHGMKAIFSTAANEEGFDADVIEAAQTHAPASEVRRACNRSNYPEKRTALMRWWGELTETAATGTSIARGYC